MRNIFLVAVNISVCPSATCILKCDHKLTLQARLGDTNANLVARTLLLAGEVAKAMGPAWDRSAREFLKAALEGLADKKKQASLAAASIEIKHILKAAAISNSPHQSNAIQPFACRCAMVLLHCWRPGCKLCRQSASSHLLQTT